ncbi:uncharacterized protein PHACADRAFT_258888, partial [Phanerochaete carnosa HHB-10118-sp]
MSPIPYLYMLEVSMSLLHCVDKYGREGKIKPGGKVEGAVGCLAGHIHNSLIKVSISVTSTARAKRCKLRRSSG